MKSIIEGLRPGRRLRVASVPEGVDALVLAAAARALKATVAHVAADGRRMVRLAEALAFFAPDIEVLRFPAWDCLPYDRTSPSTAVQCARLATLAALAERETSPHGRIVLTSVNAIVQRVPPRAAIAGAVRALAPGDRVDRDALMRYLLRVGYVPTSTVLEPGEVSVRGDIVDLFAPASETPLRLDLFGDTLERVRTFDPATQRTVGALERIVLGPVSEVLLDEDSISHFRSGYRSLFGAVTKGDPLYEAVSAGRRLAGIEHWLALFYPALETLTDYLVSAPLFMDESVETLRIDRLAEIDDYYQARRAPPAALTTDALPYQPVPPEYVAVDTPLWERACAARAVASFSPFAAEAQADVADAGGRVAYDFAAERRRSDVNLFDAVRTHVEGRQRSGRRVAIAAYTPGARERIATILAEHGLTAVRALDTWSELETIAPATVGLIVLGLDHGFETRDIAVIGEQDILGDRIHRPRSRRRRAESVITEVTALTAGELVVHAEHGIGRFDGLETLTVLGAPHDCLRLIYDGGDKLYVPVENLDVLSRFGAEDSPASLDRLGGAGWQARKARVKRRLRDLAQDLIRIASVRASRPGVRMRVPDGAYDEFAARFPYTETDDQAHAIEDVIADIGSGRPMDRLICGDVGFGKTEVALRAAFVATMSGHQVAVVVPTTLLARQHLETFAERFAGLPVRIGALSRLVGAKESARVRDEIASGSLDIVIGTHALLAKSIAFKSLGLVIVDEEQHFGVEHKEKLKRLRADVHVLTLTATPIPRTLQMALSGIRDLSVIATAPVDRLAVRTYVAPFDPVVIREAILREHHRGGQTFYVCPRIEDLDRITQRLAQLVPEIKFGTAHGRLSARALEDVMNAFYDGKFEVLVSTSIIESGLDIPSVNTLILERADMFGLAQLYQIRGRIGRSKRRAYAYLTVPVGRTLTGNAEKRLQVMQTLDTLGAGFSLASRDLDIRGAGNLLGDEQSGHIREIGFELYQKLLEEAIGQAREDGAATQAEWSPQIGVGTAILIPDDYVEDLQVRLSLYRRIAQLEARDEIDAFAAEMVDRFGPLPEAVAHLLEVIELKQLSRRAGVEKVEAGPKGAVVAFRGQSFGNPEGLIAFIGAETPQARLRPDHSLVWIEDWGAPAVRLRGVRTLLDALVRIAAGEAATMRDQVGSSASA